METNLALKVCKEPSILYFVLNTHLYPISLDLEVNLLGPTYY
jgi:hypothetical protein